MLTCGSRNSNADSTRKATTLVAATTAGSAARSRSLNAPPTAAPSTRPAPPSAAAGRGPRPRRRSRCQPSADRPRSIVPRPSPLGRPARRWRGCATTAQESRRAAAVPATRLPRRPGKAPRLPRRAPRPALPGAPSPPPATAPSTLALTTCCLRLGPVRAPAPRSFATVVTYRPRRDGRRETNRCLQSRPIRAPRSCRSAIPAANTKAAPTGGSARPATRQDRPRVLSCPRRESRDASSTPSA